jgi:hypothetical protein
MQRTIWASFSTNMPPPSAGMEREGSSFATAEALIISAWNVQHRINLDGYLWGHCVCVCVCVCVCGVKTCSTCQILN